ncbi:MAG: UDP-2,3-diacylglucosamine diphosphatase [Opitutales bacterium]|nr:UDP-2,3-diacylglucosamine diphosphatase [Opitutales bacterium]MCH8541180.1 UDP-2,3-diacylglucosamine diphosphatase [Opitutales bacterium]
MKKIRLKTLILSDVHLGTVDCKISEVNHLLKNVKCERLILNGDIIDGWRLQRSGGWTKEHSRFVRLILKMIEKKDTEVIYLRGNHDDILTRFLPLAFGNLRIVEEYIHQTAKGNYLVLHGDIFDAVTMKMPFISHLGDLGYKWLLRLNRLYNRFRSWRGKEYFSLSKVIKARVKSAVSFVSKYEDHLVTRARKKDCVGVICGHIHTPDDKRIEDIHYLNSGDWVESMTGLAETTDGTFEIIHWEQWRDRLPPMKPNEEEEGETTPLSWDHFKEAS